jgi:hypothetical protein
MKNGEEFDIKQIYSLYPDVNTKTISWRIHELVKQGKLPRSGHGFYTTIKDVNHAVTTYNYLQNKSKEVYDLLIEYSFDFYITGLDSLIGEMLHVPEKYPVLLIVGEHYIENVSELLNESGMIVATEKNKSVFDKTGLKNKVDAIILKGKDFIFSTENVAQKEKGFVDLYYAVTRLDYGVSIPELSRIYDNLLRKQTITKSKMIRAAKDRGISSEIRWLLEMDKASEKTLEFMIYLQKER